MKHSAFVGVSLDYKYVMFLSLRACEMLSVSHCGCDDVNFSFQTQVC